jgi:hypothetical protein
MSSIEQFPRDVIKHNAARVSANTIAATLHSISTAQVEYMGKAIQDGTDFLSRLTSMRSPDQAMGLHTEFATNSYQAFVMEMMKISELYVDLLEHSCEPLETLIANMAHAE